jgi:hypothetical protein
MTLEHSSFVINRIAQAQHVKWENSQHCHSKNIYYFSAFQFPYLKHHLPRISEILYSRPHSARCVYAFEPLIF